MNSLSESCEAVGIAPSVLVSKAEIYRPDLVLLDLNHFGRRDGLELCAQLRGNPKTRSVPIIMLYDQHQELSEQALREAGISTAICKLEFTTDLFDRCVRELL